MQKTSSSEVWRLGVPLHHCLEDYFSNGNLLELQVIEMSQ